MKRVALCTAILLVIILLCTASLVTVSRYQRDFTKAIQDLEQAVYQETFEALSVRAASVCRDWMDAEHVLIRFVRHTELDEVTGAMTPFGKTGQIRRSFRIFRRTESDQKSTASYLRF